MDNFRGFEDEAALSASDDEAAIERPPEIGVDERRMHVRAYNYWVSLLAGRAYPAIQDVDPTNIEDFGPHSVLLDFSGDQEDPEIAFLGRALRIECGLDATIRRISAVPSRSLLSRLTDHYLQIIANRAPIGFEAEFVSQRGHNTLYRGILMPLSSDGETIDFIYGVINWKEMADAGTAAALVSQVEDAVAAAPAPGAAFAGDGPVWADGPNADFVEAAAGPPAPADDSTLSLWPEEPALADRLSAARFCAEEASGADQRSRHALYAALGHAHDFALAAADAPEDYAELLADSGIKVQARAPMTPVAKLVFGAQYDKTRLTEFAAALSWAKREGVPAGTLAERIEAHRGGLKAIVAAERAARRPAAPPDRWNEIRARLHAARPLARIDLEVAGDAEFVLLVARRDGDGLVVVAPVTDAKTVEQAIRKSVGDSY
ncbi:MAG: hypothetical protein QOG13_1454 [Sphingomonadales bacterium]|jgi:hypothetical protein|nr:hypothetical protein [Sphingomonadales bacterium]